MRLFSSDAGRAGAGQQHHGRHFSKIAGTVLLGGLGFAPMAQPAPAAQDSAAIVARQDSTAASAAKASPKPDTAASPKQAKGVHAWFSFLRWKESGEYRFSMIKEMRNVPAAISLQPANTPDSAKGRVGFPNELALLADFSIGPSWYFNREKIAVDAGLGAGLFFFVPKTVWPTTTTWYVVKPFLGWSGLDAFGVGVKPYVSLEARKIVSFRGTNIGFGLGYRLMEDGYNVENGTYDVALGNQIKADPDHADLLPNPYTTKGKYDLAYMTVGMPYIVLNFYEDIPEHFINGGLYVGLKHVISQQISDIARQGNLVYNNPALVIGLNANLDFSRDKVDFPHRH